MKIAASPLPTIHAPLTAPGGLLIRTARRGDGESLGRMHDRCSERSRRDRWLAPLRTIPATYLAEALAESPLHHALVVEPADRPGTLLALASVACPEPPVWDVGILVEDSAQRQGLGSLLIDTLIAALPPDATLAADAFSTNRAVLERLAGFGELSITVDTGIAHAVVYRRNAESRSR